MVNLYIFLWYLLKEVEVGKIRFVAEGLIYSHRN